MSNKDGSVICVNALLDLLTVVGLDSVDNSLLEREVERCSAELRNSRDSIPEDPQAFDRHVEKLVRQLKDALRDAPERDTEYLQKSAPQGPPAGGMPDRGVEEPPPPREEPDPDADDRRQYLEREFSSTSYPKIGPGYSDSISVVSDLTTPTCMPGQTVREDEHYALPLQIDFSRRSSKPNPRRPSLENKGLSATDPSGLRMTSSDLRPPSRREVTRPGGAAATRRQNHQMTMAQLQATTGIGGLNSPSHDVDSGGSHAFPRSVNDFPSLKDSSRPRSDEYDFSAPRRDAGRRSLLRKSNQYAAAVSATASQRMLLARQESMKERKRVSRRSSTGDNNTFTASRENGDHGFSIGEEKESKPTGDPVLIDEDGFIVGGANAQDPFAKSSFNADFPSHDFSADSNSFFPAPLKDTKKKKPGTNRRVSTGSTGIAKGPKKKDERIDAVERATKKKIETLRREAEGLGDSAFSSKVDVIEQEALKEIRRIRDSYFK